ncbi:MAG: gliding motility lipoprotein GldH [Bacteroidales bacterium]|nr:gliding motility lipoprotein GldH [Bacteroidales bacterium]
MITHKTFYIFAALVLIFWSCSDNSIFKTQRVIDKKGWQIADTIRFNLPIQDASKPYNLLLDLNYKRLYPYQNIFLFVDVESPDNKTYRDTIECILSTPNGHSLGKINGENVKQELVYRYNIKFDLQGTYKITLQQAMRDSVLPFFNSIGLKLMPFEPIEQ